MTLYGNVYKRNSTPQDEVIPGREEDMSVNAAGGVGFTLDKWAQLSRFLILGTEGGTYYASETDLTRDNARQVEACVKEDGQRVVSTVVDISVSGRAPKNDAALFVLAMCSGLGNDNTRRDALNALPKVARIGTHLFQFAEFVEGFRGWGRGLRNAVARWYEEKNVSQLQYQLVKYQSRYGWSHRDLLRLSHPTPLSDEHDILFNYTSFGDSQNKERKMTYDRALSSIKSNKDGNFDLVQGFELVKQSESVKDVISFIRDRKLPREAVPTEFLNDADVWEALLEDMPMTAMIRNLGKMSSVGLLVPGKFDVINKVTAQLTDEERLRKARVHPISILAALKTYKQGHGFKGSNTWDVVPDVVDALDDAFYKSFGNVETTGKRTYLALDISASMGWTTCAGLDILSPAEGAAAMSMITYKTEKNVVIKGFSTKLIELGFSRASRLDDAMRLTSNKNFGGTDCAAPMFDALDKGLEIDTFVVYTDNETWSGRRGHPSEALKQYRDKSGIPARLIVVAMSAGASSIADPKDAGMLDVQGFDTATPQIIGNFSAGLI